VAAAATASVLAEDLARNSRQMPLKEYHDMITLAYEEIVR